MTPPAGQGALFKENDRADTWSVVNGKPLYVKDQTQEIVCQPRYSRRIFLGIIHLGDAFAIDLLASSVKSSPLSVRDFLRRRTVAKKCIRAAPKYNVGGKIWEETKLLSPHRILFAEMSLPSNTARSKGPKTLTFEDYEQVAGNFYDSRVD